jgi:hypothetical protein
MKVICTLPNASDEISGVKFHPHDDGGLISEDVSPEVAAHFLSINGYKAFDAAEAAALAADLAQKAADDAAAAAAEAAAKAKAAAAVAEGTKTTAKAAKSDVKAKAAAPAASEPTAPADGADAMF